MVSVEVLEELYCGFKKFSCVIKPWSESGISKSLDRNHEEPGYGISKSLDQDPDSTKCLDPDPD
jgi:hypothetical protein